MTMKRVIGIVALYFLMMFASVLYSLIFVFQIYIVLHFKKLCNLSDFLMFLLWIP